MMFKGKTVLVTGGASGIGHALVNEFAHREAQVYSFDVQPPKQQLEGASYHEIDICDYASLRAGLCDIPPLDYVVHSAGISCEATQAGIEKMFNVNSRGTIDLLFLLPAHLNFRAQFVHIASDQVRSLPMDAIGYATSKLAGYIVAQHFADSYPQFTVKFALPGPVDTPLFRRGKSEERIKRINPVKPDYLAAKIIELIESDKRELVCLNDFGVWTHEIR